MAEEEERQMLLRQIAKLAGDINRARSHPYFVSPPSNHSRSHSRSTRGYRGRGRGGIHARTSRQLVMPTTQVAADCTEYNRTGECKRRGCMHRHTPSHVSLCRSFLFHTCPFRESLPDLLSNGGADSDGASKGPRCMLSHTLTPYKIPLCSRYGGRGCDRLCTLFSNTDTEAAWTNWTRDYAQNYCPFIHISRPKSDPVCPQFALGHYCPRGPFECHMRHVYECIYWDGDRQKCRKKELGKDCNLYHPSSRHVGTDSNEFVPNKHDEEGP
jgi:hypothetical protein